MAFQRSDLINFFSHFAGGIASLAGYVVLLLNSGGSSDRIILASVYSLCAVFLFTCSSIYHGQRGIQDDLNPWRRLDHIAIFFMIAGTYTPICYVYLDGWWRWGILIAQWVFVVLGLVFKLFYVHGPRWLAATLYVVMGSMVVIPLGQLVAVMPLNSIILIFTGGIIYIAGAVIWASKKPNPFPGIFGFHEIFHLLVITGALLHYFVVFTAIRS